MKHSLLIPLFISALLTFLLAACEQDGMAPIALDEEASVSSEAERLAADQLAGGEFDDNVTRNQENTAAEEGFESVPQQQPHVTVETLGETTLVPQGDGPTPFVRPYRRMTVEQLDRAIYRATGGLVWTKGNNDDSELENLAQTLGRPDYLNSVFEDLDPSPVFQKFLSDAARSVCIDLVDREIESEPEARVLMVHVDLHDTIDTNPAGVELNLRMLLLRYHGHFPAAGAAELEPWRWLFQSTTHLSSEPTKGWQAVCTALISHPDFFSY